jgi:glyoxalase family protein
MRLTGLHHVTAITADAPANHAFYTRVLGLRLVKKTVNQDDVSAYHLFYADGLASPGTDLTFFDWPVAREGRGTHSVACTGLRVGTVSSLRWWEQRLAALSVAHEPVRERDGRLVLDFEDPEGQRLSLIFDEHGGLGHPWAGSPVPAPHQILGLGPVMLSVPRLEPTERVLVEVLGLRRTRAYPIDSAGTRAVVQVFAMLDGGPSRELHVVLEPERQPASPGAGGVHHVALRTPDVGEHEAWNERLRAMGVATSGPIDRFYFRSLYFREPNGILFEIATDGPGFAVDEPLDALGQRLALPPFLEPRRAEIERGLKPLATG